MDNEEECSTNNVGDYEVIASIYRAQILALQSPKRKTSKYSVEHSLVGGDFIDTCMLPILFSDNDGEGSNLETLDEEETIEIIEEKPPGVNDESKRRFKRRIRLLSETAKANTPRELYRKALAVLRGITGRSQNVVGASVNSIMVSPKIQSMSDLKRLRRLYDFIDKHRRIELEGKVGSTYSKKACDLLVALMKEKLPDELTAGMKKKFGDKCWDLKLMLEFFKFELEKHERSRN